MIAFRKQAVVLLLSAALFAARPAECALGEAETSIAADLSGLPGDVRTLVENGVEITRITTPAGMVLQEFAPPGGSVFALSWRGPRHPDLSKLLGEYFAEYQRAARERRSRRRHLLVKTEHVVVETSGHMGDLRGKAYLPALLPSGFTPEDIR